MTHSSNREAEVVLLRAMERQRQRHLQEASNPIDYARMKEVWPKQKAALTRARKAGDQAKVLLVCRDAVQVWDEIGAWPDDWSLFQRTLDDVFPVFQAPRLEDLR